MLNPSLWSVSMNHHFSGLALLLSAMLRYTFEFTHLINKIPKLDEFMFTFCIFMTFTAFYSVLESTEVQYRCNLSVQRGLL